MYPDDSIFNGKKVNRTKGYEVSCEGDDIIEEFHQKYVPRSYQKDKEPLRFKRVRRRIVKCPQDGLLLDIKEDITPINGRLYMGNWGYNPYNWSYNTTSNWFLGPSCIAD